MVKLKIFGLEYSGLEYFIEIVHTTNLYMHAAKVSIPPVPSIPSILSIYYYMVKSLHRELG